METSDETSDGCKKIILKFFVEKLGIINGDQIKLQRCHRLGSKSQHSMKGRDIIARFLWFGDRQNVWNQRNKTHWNNNEGRFSSRSGRT